MKFKSNDFTDGELREWINGLEHPEKITELDLSWADITDIFPLAALTELRSLNLLNNLDLKDIKTLEKLRKLETLDLTGTLVKSVKPLSKLSKLRSLVLDCEKLRDITPLEGLPLECLDVSCAYKNLRTLKKLPELRRLRDLDIGDRLEDLEIIGTLTQLEELCLLQLRTQTVAPLNGLVNLRRLDLSSLWFDTKLDPLAALPNLEDLNLSWTNGLELSPIKTFPKLRKLRLYFCALKSFETLFEFTNLEELDVRELQNISEKDIALLREKLPNCNIITN